MILERVIWLTGLSGAGKTTIADGLATRILMLSYAPIPIILDGDKVRKYMPYSGFSKEDRENHIKTVAGMAALLEEQGTLVIVSLISPYRSMRSYARALAKRFTEVFVDCPISVCAERDPKGLYERAKKGEINQFTGIDAVYEKPENPEITVCTNKQTSDESIDEIMRYLLR